MTQHDSASGLPVDLLQDADRERVLQDWNGPRTAFPRDLSIPALFRDVALASPDKTALVNSFLTHFASPEVQKGLESIGYAPLPESVRTQVVTAVDAIAAA